MVRLGAIIELINIEKINVSTMPGVRYCNPPGLYFSFVYNAILVGVERISSPDLREDTRQ